MMLRYELLKSHLDIKDMMWTSDILGSLRNHDGNGNGNVTEQKNKWAEQWLCTCVIIICKFLCRSVQENIVKWPNFALSRERKLRQLIFLNFYFKYIALFADLVLP